MDWFHRYAGLLLDGIFLCIDASQATLVYSAAEPLVKRSLNNHLYHLHRYTVLLSAVQPPFPLNGFICDFTQFTDGVDGR